MSRFTFSVHFNLLSKLTFRKIWNFLKVVTSYHLSQLVNKPIIWGLPVSISVEPTTACNLGCPECPSGLKSFTRNTGNIKWDVFKKLVDESHKNLIYLNFYFQGEPFLHKEFVKMVEYASSKGIFTSTSTNAHFLDLYTCEKIVQSGLDRLIISIDGTTQEIYESYRIGGNLSKVIEGTKNIVQAKKNAGSKTPFVVFQYLVTRPNEHQLNEAKLLAKDLEVDDIWFKTAQIYDYKHDPNKLIPLNNQYSRYKKTNDGEYVPKNKMSNHCWKMWHGNVMTWDGNVVPCCFDKDAHYVMGDVKTEEMEKIWNGKNYTQFRSKLLTGRKNIDICANCSEGLNVFPK